jgi:hypothetical protein
MGMNTNIMPADYAQAREGLAGADGVEGGRTKIPAPRMGMIQCSFFSADHPYQKRPMGTRILPMNMTGMRNSGLPFPPLRSQSCLTKHHQSKDLERAGGEYARRGIFCS